MKKETFLMELKDGGGVVGKRAEIVWDEAIKIADSDTRWAGVHEYDLINTFAKAFDIELPELTYKKPRSVDVAERRVEKARKNHEIMIKRFETADIEPEEKERLEKDSLEHIKYLEKKLKTAKEMEEEFGGF